MRNARRLFIKLMWLSNHHWMCDRSLLNFDPMIILKVTLILRRIKEDLNQINFYGSNLKETFVMKPWSAVQMCSLTGIGASKRI
jgi:hypothetical protein